MRPAVRLFVIGLVGGVTPFGLEIVLEELFPTYRAFAHSPAVEPWVAVVLFGALASVPFVTGYSVLFDRVVELKVVVRAALQYALARNTILFATLVPFVALGTFLYTRREESIVSLLTGPRPLLLGTAVGLGIVALQLRRRWLLSIDRRYFREGYDAEHVLTRFVGDLRGESEDELAIRLRTEIDRVLHAEAETFLVNQAGTALRHTGGTLSPLAVSATLTRLVLEDPEPMSIDVRAADSPLRRLSEAERRWLAQGPFTLLVALRRGSGDIAGLVALAAKQSGLLYSRADRHLLSAVAAAAGLALDNLRLRSTPEPPDEPAARECLECSRLNPADSPQCECGGSVIIAAVPHLLRRTFRLEQRIGAGGMGVVYRAIDLNLGRSVAIKTLPRVTAARVARLRKEARAMAAVVHPNLAVIHGVETWQGTPFLVQEYLAGGTLAKRLALTRLTPRDALDLGITLGEVLDQLHAAGVLHCDIKPSNIGFTQLGVIKLLDFGLARLLHEVRLDPDAPTIEPGGRFLPAAPLTGSGGLAGTPHYMSPEAVRGERPDAMFDLWSLSVVLFEALTGRRPFEGDNVRSVYNHIVSGERPDLRQALSPCPPPLAEAFDRLLALDPAVRPRDAATLLRELRALRQVS